MSPTRSVGVEFEGSELFAYEPPLVIGRDAWATLVDIAEATHRRAESVLSHLMDSHANLPAWAARSYSSIAEVLVGGDPRIDLARFDMAWNRAGEARIVELNTACPGGWFRARDISERLNAGAFGVQLAPDPAKFVEHLRERLGDRVALIAYGADYALELEDIKRTLLAGGAACEIFDPRPSLSSLRAFGPTGMYWKSDPLRLAAEPEQFLAIKGLCEAHLSSLGAMFVAEDKRFLREMDPDAELVAKTTLLDQSTDRDEVIRRRRELVLKPPNLTRGAGVVIGDTVSDSAWATAIRDAQVAVESWVLQERLLLDETDEGFYGDIAVFVLGGEIAGCFARVSVDPVVNVGKTGWLRPVVLASH